MFSMSDSNEINNLLKLIFNEVYCEKGEFFMKTTENDVARLEYEND